MSDPTADGGSRDGRLHRLHPASLLTGLADFAARWLLPLLLVWAIGGRSESVPVRLLVAGAALSLVGRVSTYLTTRFGIVGDRFVLRRGLLFRQERTIPLESIQNVQIRQGPLHRALSLAELRIDTAGDFAEEEVLLSGVPLRAAIDLRRRLLRRGALASEAPRSRPVLRLSAREILLAGATENRVGYIAAALAGLLELLDDAGVEPRDWIEPLLARLSDEPQRTAALAAGLLVLLLLAAGWTVSVALAFLRFHGFLLEETPRGFVRTSGLLHRSWIVLPHERVQAAIVEANPLRRRLGRVTVRAVTAGGSRDDLRSGRTVVAPLVPEARARALVRALLRSGDPPRRLRPVHPRSLRRGLVRFAAAAAAAVLALYATAGPAASLAAAPVLLALAWLLARARYRALGWALRGPILAARAGIWTRRTFFVPLDRIQSVAWRQSPIQRVQGLATLEIDIAGSGPFAGPRIVDLGAREAVDLFARLTGGP